MLVKKIHFLDEFPFTQNIADANINPYIKKAEKYDFIPTFGNSMIAALAAACVDSANWTAWAAGTYTTGAKVIHNDKVYFISVASTTHEPGTHADWTLKELNTFWYAHVKPFMVNMAFRRFSVFHGTHITQSGFREAFEDTSNEVESKRKSEITNQVKSDASNEHNFILVALADANWTFDGTVYAKPEAGVKRNSVKKFGFNSI